MPDLPPQRHLLRAKDLADARYAEPLTVKDLAREAGLSPAHFSREFRRAFGEAPHQYLMTRRLERAAALLRATDWPVVEICFAVGLNGVGSFTTSFGRMFGRTPTEYRAAYPAPSTFALVPGCVVRAYSRPHTARFEKTTPPRLHSVFLADPTTRSRRCSRSQPLRCGSTTRTKPLPSTPTSSAWRCARTSPSPRWGTSAG